MSFLKKTIITILMFFIVIASSSAAVNGEAESWARAKGEEALQIFMEKNQLERFKKMDAFIVDNFDIEGVGHFVMGRYWRYMSPEVRNYYLRVFKRYLLASYKSMPFVLAQDAYLKSVDRENQNEKGSNDSDVNVIVKIAFHNAGNNPEENNNIKDNKPLAADTTNNLNGSSNVAANVPDINNVQAQDGSVSIGFRLKKQETGFKIFDVKIAEVSSLLFYRDKFQQMLRERKDDIMWFVEDIDIQAENMENEILVRCPECQF
ncbi:MAG: ABC transporter substrate-binding protein [Alphaproteobacteria bacterium]